jgi:DNA-directed RNA polymerase subunit beta'
MSTNNIFSPANGAPIISPSQDIVMGCYYLTVLKAGMVGDGMSFSNFQEVHLAYAQGKITTHTRIKVRLPKKKRLKGDGADTYRPGQMVTTSVGRVIFNTDIVPGSMSFYNNTMRNKDLANVISDCYLEMGRRETISLLDRMKETGFQYSTRSGLSFGASDLITPGNKEKVLAEADKAVMQKQKLFDRGIITDEERYNQVIDTWTHAREQITQSMMKELEGDERDGGRYVNPIYLMAHSGARGGVEQIRQLAGMRGLMAKPNGEIIEAPIKANFRRSVGAGVFQLDARCAEGVGGYRPQDRRLGIPDP